MRKLEDTDKFYGNLLKALESEGKELDPNFDDDSKDKKELDQNFGNTNHQADDIDNNKQGETVEADANPDKVEDEGIDPNEDTKLHKGEAIKEGDDKDIDENFDDESDGTISNNFKDESETVKSEDNKWDNHTDMTGEALEKMGYEGLDIYGDFYSKETDSNAVDNKDFDANKEDESDGALDANFSKTTDITDESIGNLGKDAEPHLDQLLSGGKDKDTDEGLYGDIGPDAEKYMDRAAGKGKGLGRGAGLGEADQNHTHDTIFDTNFEDKTKADDQIDLNFTSTNELSDETGANLDYDITTSDASDDFYGQEAVGDIEDVNKQFKDDKDRVGVDDINADRTGLIKKKGFESFGCAFTCNCGAQVNENDWTEHTLMHARADEHIVPVEGKGIEEPDPDGKPSEDNF